MIVHQRALIVLQLGVRNGAIQILVILAIISQTGFLFHLLFRDEHVPNRFFETQWEREMDWPYLVVTLVGAGELL